jgi:hypothetical protein
MTNILFASATYERAKGKFNDCKKSFGTNENVRIDEQRMIVELDSYRYEFISLSDDLQRKVLGKCFDKIIIDETATEEQVALLKTRERPQ